MSLQWSLYVDIAAFIILIITCSPESCLFPIYCAFSLGPQNAVAEGCGGLSQACPEPRSTKAM